MLWLVNNHRQGEDKVYADILNRIRTGHPSDEDLEKLKQRVRPTNSTDIPKDALVVTCKNDDVNKINAFKLSELTGPEYVSEAIVRSPTQKVVKPKTDTSGAIRNTPLQKTLNLKVKARVMLTFNIDTCDGLTNGAFGEVLGFEIGRTGELQKVIVKFDEEDVGKERRKRNMYLTNKYGNLATPIERIDLQYSLSKKAHAASSSATAIQIPLRLAFAATSYKVQGATVRKPSSLVIDLRSVRQAAEAYVMLSRIQAIKQLFILESVPENKIYSSIQALEELDRLSKLALNNKKQTIKVLSCNIRSLRKHLGDLKTHPQLDYVDAICLQETWMESDAISDNIALPEMEVNLNSFGKGKGIATYYHKSYKHVKSVKQPKYQMTKISSDEEDIINIYRSEGASSQHLIKDINEVFDGTKRTIIVGDLNICYTKEKFHPVLRCLSKLGFKQRISFPTNTSGSYIDHVHVYHPLASNLTKVHVKQEGVYFTDHDLILINTVSLIINLFLNLILVL